MGSDRHIPQVGLGVEVRDGTERRQGEIHQFSGVLSAKHAAAMDVVRFHQFASDAVFGVIGREFAGFEPIPGQVLIRSIGAKRKLSCPSGAQMRDLPTA